MKSRKLYSEKEIEFILTENRKLTVNADVLQSKNSI